MTAEAAPIRDTQGAVRSLRFCMVTTFYPPFHTGGDAIYVRRLVEALASRGHRVDVIHSEDAYRIGGHDAPRDDRPLPEGVRRLPLRTRWPLLATTLAHQLGAPAMYRASLARHLERERYDVIHFHNVSLMGGPDVLRMGRAVKLYTTHEYWLVCSTHVLFAFEREPCTTRHCLACTLASRRPPQFWRLGSRLARAAASVDAFIAPSRFALERHRREGFEGPMEVIPCFVPPAPPGEAVTTQRPYFLYAGRLEKLKGTRDLLELFATYRQADLVIAGAGTLREELVRKARDLPHVRFVGHLSREELGPLYRGAIALLAPSRCYETFGLAVAEALSHGTPAIAREIGALAEIVHESGGGLTFHTLAECREAMNRLQGDTALRLELSERGLAAVGRSFTEEVHMERYLDLVERMMRGKGAAPAEARHEIVTA